MESTQELLERISAEFAAKAKIVRTRSGSETHLGIPGETSVAGHQLASARSQTFVDYYSKTVTCERCLKSSLYAAWAAN